MVLPFCIVVGRVVFGGGVHYTGLFGSSHLKDLPITLYNPYGVTTRIAGFTLL